MQPVKRPRLTTTSESIPRVLSITTASKKAPEIIDLTDSPPPETIPKTDTSKTEEVKNNQPNITSLIGNAQSQRLRSAIRELCKQIPNFSGIFDQDIECTYSETLRAAIVVICRRCPTVSRLFARLLIRPETPSPVIIKELDRKRKRDISPVHYESDSNSDYDGCRNKIEWMELCKRRRLEEEIKMDDGMSDSSNGRICENCEGEASLKDGGCCKWRRMQYSKRQQNKSLLGAF